VLAIAFSGRYIYETQRDSSLPAGYAMQKQTAATPPELHLTLKLTLFKHPLTTFWEKQA
jgi:hypothetical protein